MIGHVDYHVTDHCNFDCAGCNQFGCLAEPWYVSYEQFCDEWQVIHDKGLQFEEIHLLGGETLLHPDLDKLLIKLRSLYPQPQKIVVYTNAILLSQQKEKLLPVFQKCDIILFISRYPTLKLDYKKLEEGFPHVREWNASGFVHTSLHAEPDFDWRESFRHCSNGNIWKCRFIKEGRIYPCSTAPTMCHLIKYFPELKDTSFGKMNLEENGIEIATHSLEEIDEFLNRGIPACSFCNVKNSNRFRPWYPSEHKISEWFEKWTYQ